MKMKKNIFAKSLLTVCISGFVFSSIPANAGIFKSVKKAGNSVINDAGDVIDDAVDETGNLANDAGGSLSSAANTTASTTASQARSISKNIDQVVINGAGDLIDSAGNVINEVDLRNYASSLLSVNPLTGIADIKNPFESSMMFNVALRNGAWKSISDAIKQETIFIGLNSGASLLQIRNQLANFDNQVQTAFAGTSEFILDTAASAQLGQGLQMIRGAFSQCAGSVRNIDDCFEDFINQFIQFYQYIRHYIAKVTELKSYAKGEKYSDLVNRIHAVERKSVKYFLPILENSADKLDFSSVTGSFGESTSVQSGFEQYSSIADIRNSLEATNYSYHNDPQRACSRVSLPIICDSFEDLSNVAINRFNYREDGISGGDAAHKKRSFNAIAVKAFGSGYSDTTSGNSSKQEKMDVIHYLRSELFNEINWSQAQDQRIPYIVKDELLGGAGGAFIATDTDSIILLNEELFSDDTSIEEGFGSDDVFYARKVALEEMGHWLNWRRCQYSDDMNNCASEGDTFGDSGAKFANASLIEYSNFTDFITQLQEVSEGLWSQPTQLTLGNGKVATYEGNPSLVDIQTALANVDAKVRFRMRTQMGTPGSALPIAELGSSGIIEVNYTPPKRIKASSLDDMSKYGYQDPEQTLFLGNISIVFALENYIGAGSKDMLGQAFLLPTLYGEVGIKSTIGISIPLLKDSIDKNNLANLNNRYRDKNIALSYGVSPYIFNYLRLLTSAGNSKVSMDGTSAVWWGMTTSWPAKSNTVPFSVMMATTTLISSGVGCATGYSIMSSIGVPISPALQCAVGAQMASGTIVSGLGAIGRRSNDFVSFTKKSGWVNGIRIKAEDKATKTAVEVRFEALFKDWRMGTDQLPAFGKKVQKLFSKDSGSANALSSFKNGSLSLVNQGGSGDNGNGGNSSNGRSNANQGNNGNNNNASNIRVPDNSLTFSGGEFVLQGGESITNHNRHLVLQEDGNLRLYEYNNGSIGRELWGTGSRGGTGYKVRFQSDGNLVTYNSNGRATWATGTNPRGDILMLQEDGNLVIYSEAGRAIWSTRTFE